MKRKILQTVATSLVLALIFSISSFIFIASAETASEEVPEGYTPIYTAKEFNNIRNDLAGKYILMDDIELTAYWKPIGSTDEPFTGELDGNGYSVSNLKISGSYQYVGDLNFGLFTAMEGGSVRNLAVSVDIDVTFTGSTAVPFKAGAIAASADGVTVENCFVSGTINLDSFGKGSAGGLFGYINMCSPKNCINYANVSLTTNYQLADISVGGIAGKSTVDTFVQCCNYGEITVMGYDITNASRKLNLGGILGSVSNVGGCIIKNCYNKGTVGLNCSTPSTCAGGITAASYQTENCYNAGQIIIPENYMGLAGEISGNLSTGASIGTGSYIKNVYYIDNGIYPSYIDGAAPDEGDFENAKLLTEEEFKNQESFVGFDFETVWEMEENGYPVLQNQPEIPQSLTPSGKCGDDVYYEFNKLTGDLRIYGSGDMDNYDTLSMFEWYFCAPWFFDREYVKNVVIEEGVTSIGACAFDGCENMTSIDVPESIKKIGWGAFAYCDSLESIVIPEGVETIGDQAFYGCIGLKTVSIPKSVTSLESDCFYYCISLESITVDSENPNYSSDEYGALFDKNKTVLIRYPSGNERTSYTIPDSVVRISGCSFKSSENLKNITFSNNLKEIGSEAFMGCSGLTELEFPSSLEIIYSFSFYYCTGLKSVTIPEGVKTIGSCAFAHCEALETISLPESLERIERDVFEYSAFYDNEANWDNGVLYCGKYLLDVKEDFAGKLVIKPGTRMITDYAVNRCENITEVTMPDSLKIIGEGAFNMCYGLKSVTIPASVTTLIGSTFRFCDSLVSVTIPETVTVMGSQIFYNCENLESVVINAKVSTIGHSMFYDCPKLTSVKLPDTITTIDEAAFRECDSLETIVLPEGVEVIADEGFAWSPKLTNVNLPESLITIGRNAFNSTNINNITIPKNVSSIGENAFDNTANLSSFAVDENNSSFMYDGKALYTKDKTRLLCCFVANDDAIYVMPNEVTQIDGDAFRGNKHLERITIPDSVTQTSGDTFGNCSNLKSAAIGSGISVINTYSFRNCTSLEKVYLPASLTKIISYAFSGCDNIKDIYYGGTEEQWSKISGVKGDSVLSNATIHYNHVHSHSLDADSEEVYSKYGYRLYSCICGHYYAEYDLVSKSDKYDVTAIYAPDCFNEEITLDVETVTGDREPGGVYMVDGKTYVQVGVYNIKAVGESGAVVQPNEGCTVMIKMALPEEYKDKTDMVVYHRYVDGGREKLSTTDGTLTLKNGYMYFKVSKFSEFEILAGASELSVSKLPAKTAYSYKEEIDLTGIQLKITNFDGSVEYITDTSKMTVENYDSSKIGTQTVTVNYEQYSCTVEVSVSYTWWQWIIRILFLGFLWY